MRRREIRNHNNTETRATRSIDDLEEFLDFRDEILPKLRLAMRAGKDSEEIYAMVTAYAAARTCTIALTEPDSSKAMTAIKEILDRTQGKATERKQVTHKFENVPDDQLDSLLISRLTELDEVIQ